jgi:AraC-like DNA-binding protein
MAARTAEPVAALATGPSLLRVTVQPMGGCRPPGAPGLHTHEFFTLLYVERAGGWHQLDGGPVPVRAGDLFAIPAGVAHDYGGIDPRHGTAVMFMPDAITTTPADRVPLAGDARWAAFLSRRGDGDVHLSVPESERPWFRRLIRGLGKELDAQRLGFGAAARAQLSLLLVCASRLAEPEIAEGPPLDPVLRDLFDVIDQRFRDPLSLDQLATAVARSPRHLSRTVREMTGGTVIQLLDHRRMEEARRLLLETDEKVESIAHAVGYYDPGYFRRRFREAHGLSPSAWRQMNR